MVDRAEIVRLADSALDTVIAYTKEGPSDGWQQYEERDTPQGKLDVYWKKVLHAPYYLHRSFCYSFLIVQ